nr:hypothetical protein PDK3.083 [Rhodococcus sp. DK17]
MRLLSDCRRRDRDTQLSRGQCGKGQWLPEKAYRAVNGHRCESERDAEQDQRRVRAEVAQVQRGAQPHEEQGTEEPFGNREQLLGQAPRFAHARDGQPERETGEHDRYVGVNGQRREGEQHAEVDPQLQREAAVLRFLVQTVQPAAAVRILQERVEQCRRCRDGGSTYRGAGGLGGVDHEWKSDDARGVCDRDLGHGLHYRGALEPQRVDQRKYQGGRRRRDEDRVQGRMAGAECPGDPEPGCRREDPDDCGPRGALCESRPDGRIADGYMGAGNEHDQRESDVREKGEGGIFRVDPSEARRAQKNPYEQLTEHHRQVPPPTNREQGTG